MSPDNTPEDDNIEALLRRVGARTEPSTQIADEVRTAVHAEWRASLAARASRRRAYAYGLAASVALAVMMLALTINGSRPAPATIAAVAAIEGSLQLIAEPGAAPVPLSVGSAVKVGDRLQTGADTRIALTFAHGLSLRIDARSRIELAALDRITLDRGAVYVDSGPERSRDELQIATRAGVARHVGTQYQLRQDDSAVLLSVREGRVELDGPRGPSVASAGEMLRVAHDGAVERDAVAANDPSWNWAAQAAPTFKIDNQPLSAFLEWVGRETGRTVVFATEQARVTAQELVLRGAIDGMDPDAALAAVLSTTDLRAVATSESITIDAAAR